VRKARKIATEYELLYGEEIPVIQLVSKVAAIMQEYTQSGFILYISQFNNLFFSGVRPFGVSTLIGGWDAEKGPLLFQADPSVYHFTCI